jgi:hypothetical protein
MVKIKNTTKGNHGGLPLQTRDECRCLTLFIVSSHFREYIDNNRYTWDEDEENPYKIGNSQQKAAANADKPRR